MRCCSVGCLVVILMVAYTWSKVWTAHDEKDLCRYFMHQLLVKYDPTIISPALDKRNNSELKSTIDYCNQPGTKKAKVVKQPSDILKWIPVVRTYINCKLSGIILKLLLLIEHFSLRLFKTNNNVESRSLKALDEVNWEGWKTQISPELINWIKPLEYMLLILRDFDVREKIGDFDKNSSIEPQSNGYNTLYDNKNVPYLMEALKTYYLFLDDNVRPHSPLMSIREIPNDKRLNRVRLIHFYVWDLTEKYSRKHCNLSVNWKFSFLESLFGKKEPLVVIKEAMETHLRESLFLVASWKHDHGLDSSKTYFNQLVAAPRFGKLNSEWVKSLKVQARWNGAKKSITQIYEDVYVDFRPANRVQFESFVTEMMLSVFFYELYEYIQIYVNSVMTVPEKNLYFGIDDETDYHLLRPVRGYIDEMNTLLKQQSWNSPSKNTIELIAKNITSENIAVPIQDTIAMTTTVDDPKKKKKLPPVTTLSVIDLLLAIEVLFTNYKSMGIVFPKRKFKKFSSSRHAHGYLNNHNKKQIQSYIDNLKIYIV